jgi:hypothetical protein|uniref:Uncharacterized protein n=1 Tax=viral metagenome TaxID=1070528 RepID=A0A6C0LP54_9ZZZZ
MSQAIASARKRRGVPQTPEPVQSRGPIPQQPNVNASGLTLPQVISIVDKRLVTLETFMRDSKQNSENITVSRVNDSEPSEEQVSWIDEFNHRFELLAEEMSNMKDIVLKLQSYTMEVNKTLLEERIHVFSDLGENKVENIESSEPFQEETLSDNLTSVNLKHLVEEELNFNE